VSENPTVSNAAMLLLCRLLVPAATPTEAAKAHEDLAKVAGRNVDEEWERVLADTVSAGLVERIEPPPPPPLPLPKPVKGENLQLTEAGRDHGKALLDRVGLPASAKFAAAAKKLGPVVSDADLIVLQMTLAKTPKTDDALRKPLPATTRIASDQDWSDAVARLQEKGLLERPAGKLPKAKNAAQKRLVPLRLRLTDAGRSAALRFLDVQSLPSNMTWKKLLSDHVFQAAVPPDARPPAGSTPAQSLAFFLAAELGVSPATTVKAVIERAALAQLGLPDARGWDDVVRHFIGKKLDVELPPMSPASLATQVPRMVFKTASNPKADQIRARRLASWAAGQFFSGRPEGGAVVETQAGTALRAAAKKEEGIDTFARQVHALAAATTDGRFGSNKIFIARLWDHWGDRWPGDRPPLEQFKRMLVDAHRKDLLTLSRADLVAAMDPADVARSETRYETAEFHFVLIEPGRVS
jgi:hypothetical protein